jgi:hypothetical protein
LLKRLIGLHERLRLYNTRPLMIRIQTKQSCEELHPVISVILRFSILLHWLMVIWAGSLQGANSCSAHRLLVYCDVTATRCSDLIWSPSDRYVTASLFCSFSKVWAIGLFQTYREYVLPPSYGSVSSAFKIFGSALFC